VHYPVQPFRSHPPNTIHLLPHLSKSGRSHLCNSKPSVPFLNKRRIIYKCCTSTTSIIYLSACNSFRMPSYIPNIIAALGTVLSKCGVRPPYMATMPSSFQTSLKHWIKPVYLGFPFSNGAWRRRVRATYKLISPVQREAKRKKLPHEDR
jgi:hypothetical protein